MNRSEKNQSKQNKEYRQLSGKEEGKAIVVCDRNQSFISINGHAESLLQIPQVHFLGQSCNAIFGRPMCTSCPYEEGGKEGIASTNFITELHQENESQTLHIESETLYFDDPHPWLVVHMLSDKTIGNGIQSSNIIGEHPLMQELLALIEQVARTDLPVLVNGETGTGKEVIAQELHRIGRPNGPFIPINCAALPEELMENELFGHETGAFTGATKSQAGRFELADGGTLFLDEIGDMPLRMQVKLLRAIDQGIVERLGGVHGRTVDVRIVSATHRNLEEMVQQGTFRQDLLFRLRGAKVHLPSLRDRRSDIAILAHSFLKSKSNHPKSFQLSSEAMQKLLAYDWPGNVRELQHVLNYAMALCDNYIISTNHLPEEIQQVENKNSKLRITKDILFNTLVRTDWNQSEAARILGISRKTVGRNIRKFGLAKPGQKKG